MAYEMTIGSRAQVYHGTALKTPGGLKKKDIFKNKHGRYVSKKKHFSAKRENRLVKSGYGTKKGVFGFVKLDKTQKKRKGSKSHRRRGHRGGGVENMSAQTSLGNAAPISGIKGNEPSVNVQFAAGMGN
jgi:hypothetical protein